MTKHGNLKNNTRFNAVQVAENNYTEISTKSQKNKTKVITLCTMQEEHQLKHKQQAPRVGEKMTASGFWFHLASVERVALM